MSLINSLLRVNTNSKQHIKDIRVMQINCMLCGQLFVHVGGISLLVVISVGVVIQKSNYYTYCTEQ